MPNQTDLSSAATQTQFLDATILVIDDQRMNVRFLEMALQAKGYTNVLGTVDPLEGLELCKSHQVDLILLDMHMPHMDGLEVLAQVKLLSADDPWLPVMFLTADTDRELRDQALDAGAKDFLTKPVDASEAMLRIRNLLETRFLHLSLHEKNLQLADTVETRTTRMLDSEAQHRLMIENNVDGMMVLDGKGTALFINPAAEALFGQACEDLNGLFVDIPKGGTESVELPVTRPDGTVSIVELRSSRIQWNGEENWLASLRDVTERNASRDSLRTANAELAKALADLKSAQSKMIEQERLGALGQMASGIAHDFNNALSPILGFSELLLIIPGILQDEEKVTTYLKTINTAAQDAAAIVARLRQFYRPSQQGDEFYPLVPYSVIKESVKLTQPKWKNFAQSEGRLVDLQLEIVQTPNILGDEAELREVMTNLIFNAVDAMPEGGTLTLGLRPDGDAVIFEVRDTGTGMTEEVRRACLEPFFSTKGEHGTGLGLSMVFGIIQRHHGTLDIQSEVGKGTSFLIRLPVPSDAVVKKEESSGPRPAYRRLRVLVVDDEPNVRAVVEGYLEADGHKFESAGNGLEGLDKFMKGRFDLVITDQAMPEMGGDQFAIAVKKLAPDKPIIMLSGFGVFMKAKDQIPAGVDFVLSKPLKLKALQKGILEAFARRAEANIS